MFAEDVSNWFVLLDDLVHHWLSERWLIKLIVTKLTVANQVNNNVSEELLTILCRELEGALHILHRVSVNVEDRSIDGLGDITAVLARSALVWSGGEANLIVHYNMNSSTN